MLGKAVSGAQFFHPCTATKEGSQAWGISLYSYSHGLGGPISLFRTISPCSGFDMYFFVLLKRLVNSTATSVPRQEGSGSVPCCTIGVGADHLSQAVGTDTHFGSWSPSSRSFHPEPYELCLLWTPTPANLTGRQLPGPAASGDRQPDSHARQTDRPPPCLDLSSPDT